MGLLDAFVHDLNPVALRIFEWPIHWYGCMWILGFFAGSAILQREGRLGRLPLNPRQISDFVLYAMLATVVGGRLGYVVFYDLMSDHPTFPSDPLKILKVWGGGLSFHGGVIGLVIVLWLTAKKMGGSLFRLGDALVLAATPGIFFVRCGNFINGELYGRPAEGVPWAVVFPRGGPVPRHPSQLYEGLLEGLLLGIVLFLLRRTRWSEVPGRLAAVFLAGYGAARFLVEFFREPDAQFRGEGEAYGFVLLQFSMGQILCFVMMLAGLLVYWLAGRGRTSAPKSG